MKKYFKVLSTFLILVFLFMCVSLFKIGLGAKNNSILQSENTKDKASSNVTKDNKPQISYKNGILVKYKNDGGKESVKNKVKSKLKLKKLESKKHFKSSKTELLEIGNSEDVKKTVDELKKDPNVLYAQPDYTLNMSDIPQDTRFDEQWGLSNNGQEIEGQAGTSGMDINALKAWDITSGNETIMVGVLDSGIDINHEDLAGSIYNNADEIPGNGIDDDSDGFIDNLTGWDFLNNDNTVYDSASADTHGTSVAGIIAAGSNQTGVRGAAPNIKILPLKFADNSGGLTSNAIKAIEYAKAMGVKIINCSFGGYEYNYALKEAMMNSGILFVCAAGNNGADITDTPFYPACYGLSNILSVAAVDNRGEFAAFSNYGRKIGVAAPGVNILSTTPNNGYGYLSGTSMAAPFVSATAALLLSNNSDMNYVDIELSILNNVKKKIELGNKVTSSGIVDAYSALQNCVTGSTVPVDTIEAYDETKVMDSKYGLQEIELLQEQLHYGESGISPVSGNLSLNCNDMGVRSLGMDFNVSRTYNSRDTSMHLLGRGWRFGFEGKLERYNYSDWFLKATLPKGNVEIFKKNDDGSYTSQYSRSTLVIQLDNTIVITTKDQYKYYFNSSNYFNNSYLYCIKDKNDNTININVDSNGKINTVSCGSSSFTITYNSSNLIDTICDNSGRIVEYDYTNGKLNKVTDPMGISMKYTVNDTMSNNLIYEIRDNNNSLLASFTYWGNPGSSDWGRVSEYYDYCNNNFYTYHGSSYPSYVIDSNGKKTEYHYDGSGYVTQTLYPDSSYTINEYYREPDQLAQTLSWNKYGDLKSTKDRNGNITHYERDNMGNITKITNPDSSIKTYTYDDKSNMTSETDETGSFTQYIYDSNMINLVTKAQYLNKLTTGQTISLSDNNSSDFGVTSYEYYSDTECQQLGYSAKGLLKSVADPELNTTSYTYYTNGDVKSVNDPETDPITNIETNKITSYAYNSYGWKTLEVTPGNNYTRFVYNKNGQLEATKKIICSNPTANIPKDYPTGGYTNFIYLHNHANINDIKYITINDKDKIYGVDTGNGNYNIWVKSGAVVTSWNWNGTSWTQGYDNQTFSTDQQLFTGYCLEDSNFNLKDSNANSPTATATNTPAITPTPTGTPASIPVPSNTSVKTFGGTVRDCYNSICNDFYGYVVAAGYSYSNDIDLSGMNKGNRDAILVKYDTNGNVVLKKTFGGSNYDEFKYVISVYDGYVAVGYTEINSTISYEALIVKYNLSGNVLWIKKLTGSSSDYYSSVTSTSDGYVAVGYSSSTDGDMSGLSKGNTDAVIVKYDYMGNVVWKKSFGGTAHDYFCSVATVSDGFIAVGNSSSTDNDLSGVGRGGYNAIIVKYDFNGNVIWKKDFGGYLSDYFNSVVPVSDGYITAGYSYSYDSDLNGLNNGSIDAIIVKYDLNGNVIWKKNYGGSQADYYNSITLSTDGYIAAGESDSTDGDLSGLNKGNRDAILVKYDSNGNVVWQKSFGGTSYDYYNSATTVFDGYVAVGYSLSTDTDMNSLNKGGFDAVAVKYNCSFAPQSPSPTPTSTPVPTDSHILKCYNSTTRIVYDSNGRKSQEISPNLYNPEMDGLNAATPAHTYNETVGNRYTYYTNGKVKTRTDSENNTTSYTYDFYGNLQTETRPNNSTYYYEYDWMDRPTKTYFKDNSLTPPVLLEEFAYTILADKNTQKTHTKYLNSTETAITTYTYDYAGRQLQQQNPDNTTLYTSYYANGTINTNTDAKGNVTYCKYDGLNRPTETWVPFESTDNGILYTYSFISYDKTGNKKIERIGKDKVALYGIPTTFITQNYDYYKNGKLKTVTDSAGRKTSYCYDDDGNLAKEEVYTQTTPVEKINVTEYVNNSFGKPCIKKVHVNEGDIFGNDFDSTEDYIIETAYTYDKNGNILTETHDNVTKTYTYDSMNRQLSVSQPGQDENGTAIEIKTSVTYNWEGKPLVTTDAKGNTTESTYNQRGLLEKTNSRVTLDGVLTDCITAFEYDLAGRKIREVAPKDYDSSKTLSQVNRVEYIYDLMGRLKVKQYIGDEITIDPVTKQFVTNPGSTIVQNAYKYDNNGNVVKELTGLGYEAGTGTTVDDKINNGYGTEYTYNLANKVFTKLDAVSKEWALSYTAKYEYDGAGRKLNETNTDGVITSYSYDDAGNVHITSVKKTVNDAEQIVSTNTYDLAGNMISTMDGNNNITTFEYNALNKLRKEIHPGDTTIPSNTITYQYDVSGNVKSKSGSMGVLDLYTYDNQGRELSHTQKKQDGTELISTYQRYDENGNKRFEVDGNGNQRENTYNEANKLVSSRISVTNADNRVSIHTTTNSYDKNGNMLTQTDRIVSGANVLNKTNTSVYDPLNRVIEKKDQLDKSVEKIEYNHDNAQIKSYDASGNLTQFEYDKNGKLSKTIDPQLHETSQTYDNEGRIFTKTDGRSNTTQYLYNELGKLKSVTNAVYETSEYTYDLNGNMLTQTVGDLTTTYEYNAANKIARKIDNGGRTGTPGSYVYDITKVDTYTYHADGSLEQKIDKNGATTTYVYDIHGRLKTQTTTKTGSTTVSISYTYDGNGNQLTVTDNTGTTTRTYDGLNRVKTKDVTDIGNITYTYDIMTLTDYQGEKSSDSKGNDTYKYYDRAGRLVEVIANGNSTVLEYYDNGNRKKVLYPGGASEEYTYYPDNLLWTLTNKKTNGSIMDVYTYTYDAAHNMSSKNELINGSSKGTTSYTYDNLNRLLSVTEPSGKTTVYTYDNEGNRETETITDGSITLNTYSYNGQNRLTGIETKVDNVVTEISTYDYDNNGNQLGTSRNGQAVAVNTYDLLNQLVASTTDGKTVTNKYNGEGLRVEKSFDGQITRYFYEYEKVILEVDGSGNQTGRNVYGTNLLSRTVAGQTLYYMYNGHGDVTGLIDSQTGEIAGFYYYDAFGNICDAVKYGDVDGDDRITSSDYALTQRYVIGMITEFPYDYGKLAADTNGDNSITSDDVSYIFSKITGMIDYLPADKNQDTYVNDKSSYGYAGYYYDGETGLYYCNARMYDPKIARFLQEDTYTGDPNDPLSLNLYTYCHNEPLMYSDPTGHYEELIEVYPGHYEYVDNGYKYANVQFGDYTFKSGEYGNGTTSISLTEFKTYMENKYTYYAANDLTPKIDEIEKAAFETKGDKRVNVSNIMKISGGEDIVSHWTDDKGTMNVLLRPEMKNAPVQLVRKENNFDIRAYVRFEGDYNQIFPGTSASYAGIYFTGKTYGEVAVEGIESNWSKNGLVGTVYDFGIGQNINVSTKVFVSEKSPTGSVSLYKGAGEQRFLNININNTKNDGSYHLSYDFITGCHDLFTFNWDFDSTSWGISDPGNLTLYKNYNNGLGDHTQSKYARAAAHEFGHELGIDDAYEAPGKSTFGKRPEAKGTQSGEVPDNDIMRGSGWDDKNPNKVTINDVEMAWEAFKNNKCQYFMKYDGNKISSAIKSYK